MFPSDALLMPVLFLAAICGGVLVWRGMRGKRHGDHLHCRVCEHDLYGLPWATPRCPECGTLIRYGRPRGRWERVPKLIRAGGSVLLVSTAWLSILVVAEVKKIDWIKHEPLWMVLNRISAGAFTLDGERHLDELERRLGAGLLKPGERAAAINSLLKYQADPKLGWVSGIGSLIEAEQSSGRISAELWNNYTFNTLERTLKVRALTRSGDPIAAALLLRSMRVGRWHGTIDASVAQVFIDGIDAKAAPAGPVAADLKPGALLRIPFSIDHTLAPGRHELTARITIGVLDDYAGTLSLRQVRTISMTQTFAIADGIETIRRTVDPRGKEVVLFPGNGDRWNRYARFSIENPVYRSTMDFAYDLYAPREDPPDYVLSYDVILRNGQKETPAGTILWNPGVDPTTHQSIANIPLEATDAELLLRPSRDRAIRDVDSEGWLDTTFVVTGIRSN